MPETHGTPLGEVYKCLDALIGFAHSHLDLDPRDIDITRNRILGLFSLDSYTPTNIESVDADIDKLLSEFRKSAVASGLFPADEGPIYDDVIMGLLTANPSAVQDKFSSIEHEDTGMAAMDWLYRYCVDNTYVKKSTLDKNPRFNSHGLVITINLAKPEFKNMKKAAAGNSLSGGYPQCTICHENEGFSNRNKRTLRTIPLTLGHEAWFWQYSPYGYFHQHGICVNERHEPMHVDRSTFEHLLDFVDQFPKYFLGCNAALPRIGGSVLAHDHYQGGGEMLPMHKAKAWATYSFIGHPETTVEILDWPGTAVRVVSRRRRDIIEASDAIRKAWIGYDNPDLCINSTDAEGKRQSALSPSAIITERGYEMSLIFRNNAVNKDFPEGIFHAHSEFWPIKQEPIGLIEAQGLFILPGRLIDQLQHIKLALIKGEPLPRTESEFTLEWSELNELLRGSRDPKAIQEAVQEELGSICERILSNTAVFKSKETTSEFLTKIGFRPKK
ncbi:MAG: galactose-1-phosphate uridylyltransferase [Bifidobacteriaceae bacterium]|jgi:UDPglucose--hexose-1-phosphate uridylyltransferase|nr:galactose-1-phosphate uridylyltransferase [Bifidobacteriaceae bacterium]